MAVVTVSANNTRVEDSEATTGWSNRGGGAGVAAESILVYQGTNVVNRKCTATAVGGSGFEYDPVADSGSAQDMTATATRTWMVKALVTDSPDLNTTEGLRIYIGSDSSNEYAFVIAGSDAPKAAYSEYLLRNSYIIIPIDPNISGYRDASLSSGTATLTAIDLFGIEARFQNGSAKAENVALDAIDLGTGLTLTRGDSTDTDGVWTDFVDEDEGTTTNRWGYANSLYSTDGVLFFFGTMTIGESGTATEFNDSSATILWPDGFYQNGFSNVTVDLSNASTVVTDGSRHTSLGTTAVEDTRADYTWSGTSGTGTASHILKNFRNYVMTSAVTMDGADIECDDLTQGSGTIQNSTIRPNSASTVACCDDPSFANISDSSFVQNGSGHMFEITSPGTYNFDNLTFSGFGADASNDAAIFNDSGGAVTINVLNGGSTPSYRNGTSATTTVQNTVLVRVTVVDVDTGSAISGARVLLEADTGGPLTAGDDILDGTTNGSGIIEDSGFNYSSDQPVIGKVRKGSTSTYYKQGSITGTITSSGFQITIQMVKDE